MVTVFVAVMMIAVEYVSVLTRGAFQHIMGGARWMQYAAAAILGALPGCLGPFMVVALYSHRAVSFGAIVTTMIATSGDEAFVMLSLFPATALWLTIGLAIVGFVAGPIVDTCVSVRYVVEHDSKLTLHDPDTCRCLPAKQLLREWRRPSTMRTALTLSLFAFVAVVGIGIGNMPVRGSVRITLLAIGVFAAFVVSTVPDHFLRDHLWQHVVKNHVPRIFVWTLGALMTISILEHLIDLTLYIQNSSWQILGIAGLVGIIPESGPHLVFVTLFANGNIPVSILVASSIVQDGHGMLPLLAESRRDFFRVKAVNLIVGVAVGAFLLALGR
jgi:hypothetical protein